MLGGPPCDEQQPRLIAEHGRGRGGRGAARPALLRGLPVALCGGAVAPLPLGGAALRPVLALLARCLIARAALARLAAVLALRGAGAAVALALTALAILRLGFIFVCGGGGAALIHRPIPALLALGVLYVLAAARSAATAAASRRGSVARRGGGVVFIFRHG